MTRSTRHDGTSQPSKTHRTGGVAILSAVAMLLSGCAAPAADPDNGDANGDIAGQSIRVAWNAAATASDVVGMKAMELLREQGVEVEESYFDGAAQSTQTVLAGRADIATNPLDDVINAGLIAFGLNRPRNTYALIATPEIKSLQDLVGTVVAGGEAGATQNVLTEAILVKHGMSIDDITLANIGGASERTNALLSGRVDATMVYGDNHMRLMEAGMNTITSAAEEFPGLHDGMFAATPEWLEEHGDLAIAITTAQIEAARWFHESPDEWLELAMERVETMDEGIARSFYDYAVEIDMYPLDGMLSEQSLLETYEMLLTFGAVEEAELADFGTVEYINAARAALGIEEK